MLEPTPLPEPGIVQAVAECDCPVCGARMRHQSTLRLGWTADQMHAHAAARDAAWQARCDALVAQAVAQERERWRLLIDEGTPQGQIAAGLRARTQGDGNHG